MNIFERSRITVTQAGFDKNCRTADVMRAARFLTEKHYEKHSPLYFAFVDLDKVFDRLVLKFIWYMLRQHRASVEQVLSLPMTLICRELEVLSKISMLFVLETIHWKAYRPHRYRPTLYKRPALKLRY